MVETVEIPLSWANNIPGVSGVEDVSFDVPQVSDLEDAVDRVTPDIDQIGERIDFITLDIADIQDRLDDVVDDIAGEVDDVTVDLGDVADDIRDEVDDALAGVTVDPDQIADDVADDLEDALPTITLNVEEIAGAVVDQLEEDIQDLAPEAPDLADDALQDVEDLDVPAPQVNIDGVFGPLTSDVVSAFNQVLDQRVQAPDVDIPSVGDVRTAVSQGLIDTLEDLPGGDLLTDPETFISRQLLGLIPNPDDLADSQALEDFDSQVQQLEEEYDL